jgi:hypothetical protein
MSLIHNPYYCIWCQHEYNENETDRGSTEMNFYARFLGFCDEDCFNSLSPALRNQHMLKGYAEGDVLKRRHQFYHQEIPFFHKNNQPKKRKLKIDI